MISTVTGRFTDFYSEIIQPNEDFTDSEIIFEADVNSISTGVVDRDSHLKSADFFDSENHPTLTFKSTTVIPEGKHYKITGNLHLHGIYKEVNLIGKYLGNNTDLYGNNKYGFELSGEIKRSEFGLTFNAITEKGGLLVSDDVRLVANVQFISEN
jgi:polyisoprenoid-binding protein YceI